ncbi:cation transporter, partial [Escherichia coli]|nr:cation transporter [Escherichia coli]
PITVKKALSKVEGVSKVDVGFEKREAVVTFDDTKASGHCCKVSDEAAFCLIQRPYISKTLLTRRISPRGSP